MAPSRKRLGDILLEMGAVDGLQLRAALGYHQQWGVPLGRALVERRICSVAQVLAALQEQTGLQVVQLDQQDLSRAPAHLVPRWLAERHRMLPLEVQGARNEVLVVAAAAPVALDGLDAVRSASGKVRVHPLLAADDALERALLRVYGPAAGESEGVAWTPSPPEEPARALGLVNDRVLDLELPAAEPGELLLEAHGTHLAPIPAVSSSFAAPPAPVLLFGWTEEVARALAAALAQTGVDARAVDEDLLLSAGQEDVVISSTLALEALLAPGQKLVPRAIVCGAPDRSDVQAAQSLGARIYLPPPFSVVQLKAAVERCHEAAARRRHQR